MLQGPLVLRSGVVILAEVLRESAGKSIAPLTGLFLGSQRKAGNYYEQFGYPLHVCSILSSVRGRWIHGGLRLGEIGVVANQIRRKLLRTVQS